MQYDGSINIDTRIDTKNFNKSTKGMTAALSGVLNAVKNIAKVMAAAFIGGSIINSIRGVVQSFDLLSSSVGEKIKPLSDALAVLKGTFVNLIVQAFIPLIPYLVIFVQWLTTILSTVTQIVAALFGFNETVGSIMSTTAAGAQKSEKAARGALAAFDQINVLETQKDKGEGGLVTPPPLTIPPDLLAKVEDFKNKALEFLKPLLDAFQRLKESPLWKTIGEGLQWVWENVLIPFGAWFIQNFLPKFLDFVTAAANTVNEALIALKPLWDWLWENVLKPAGEALGEAIIVALEWLTEKLKELATWISNNQAEFQKIAIVVASLGTIIVIALLGPLGVFIALMVAAIALLTNFGGIWDWVKLVATEAWKDINTLLTSLGQSIADNIVTPMQEAFGIALDWIHDKFVSIFEGIQDFVRSSINNIIDYINGMVQSIATGINTVVTGVNTVGAVVGAPILAPVVAPQIPRLATGAVIPPNSQFLAVLGDQKSGTNIEAPADLIRQIVREELGSAGGDITVPFTIELDGETIYKNQKRVSKRHGTSLITSGSVS